MGRHLGVLGLLQHGRTQIAMLCVWGHFVEWDVHGAAGLATRGSRRAAMLADTNIL